jgi:pilus assembly protein Flp/PilA
MKNLFVRFSKDESGATAIEYGLIAAGISVAIASIVFSVGTKLVGTFSLIEAALP